jgi:hypothetical protein
MKIIRQLFLTTIFIGGGLLSAQTGDCKVLLPRLAGSYTGDCRKGFAHGKGLAQGLDRYEGEFKKGLPEGLGLYRWADGTWYEGYWKEGLREGSGKMVYGTDSARTGYWRADKYIGEKNIKRYEILQSRYVARSSFVKTANQPNQVKVKLSLGGTPNTTVQDFSMTPTSGDEYNPGNAYGLQNVTFPVTIRLQYRTWNVMRTVMTDVTFEFRINEPGSWEVTVQN